MGTKHSTEKEKLRMRPEKGGTERNDTVLQTYQRLDKEICFLESFCSGPRLATAQAWIQHLQAEFELIDENVVHVQSELVISDSEKLPENKEIVQLALRLGVLTDVRKAEAEEEFFANLNQSEIQSLTRHFQKEIIVHTYSRMRSLIKVYNKLSSLYTEQDDLIASITNGIYINKLEEDLDIQLEIERDIRDKLSSAVEQWRICAFLLKSSLKFVEKANETWSAIQNTLLVERRLELILECRNCMLASLTTLECAQLALPQVDIKFISSRQILAMKHINIYLITDAINKTRSLHVQQVLTAYEKKLQNAISWLLETFNSSLKKDFNESENKVSQTSKQLRDLRLKIFSNIIRNKLFEPTKQK